MPLIKVGRLNLDPLQVESINAEYTTNTGTTFIYVRIEIVMKSGIMHMLHKKNIAATEYLHDADQEKILKTLDEMPIWKEYVEIADGYTEQVNQMVIMEVAARIKEQPTYSHDQSS